MKLKIGLLAACATGLSAAPVLASPSPPAYDLVIRNERLHTGLKPGMVLRGPFWTGACTTSSTTSSREAKS